MTALWYALATYIISAVIVLRRVLLIRGPHRDDEGDVIAMFFVFTPVVNTFLALVAVIGRE
jgi:hypothetical protein